MRRDVLRSANLCRQAARSAGGNAAQAAVHIKRRQSTCQCLLVLGKKTKSVDRRAVKREQGPGVRVSVRRLTLSSFGSGNGAINVGSVGDRNVGDNFLCRRILQGER